MGIRFIINIRLDKTVKIKKIWATRIDVYISKMKNYHVLLVLLFSFLISSCAKPNGPEKEENLKIIDGIEVVPHSMPYMVAIKSNINGRNMLCGGSLITAHLVLTSAMCVSGATEAEIILGAHNIETPDEEGQQHMVATEFKIHEKFDPKKIHDDIALIQLPRPATLNKFIGTIKLPDVTEILNSYDEKEATVAGWGKISDAVQETSNVLRSQNLTIIPVLVCEISYLLNIRLSQMCTSGVSLKNICLGDAGGPLVLDGVLIGIASYGSSLGCSIGFPGVYTRVTSYLDWLLLSTS
ncbi:unnamed protein product [Psylliodes chrysocephalus]|uniref:Peptidase S1 domain-containing protein n=1 Tax=Psylliodes chrysocephalus TaxID=3402493 RepID=A0A9P0CP77_9CUCU|nr:unnamed protein product [Psylliodes chrysocephala]